ncbi:cytochrome P450 [Rhodococcus sp. NCIMB 12038]|jgi:cytochrome P450|uniref:cytochrome P450 n=1 Tax=Rhodococcus sp. NCIMB 12038 TaxID=933800 RepID=UPI0015C592F0|nr:cytochrome P450 [Rhodococcus sp. NCIMB 12038]
MTVVNEASIDLPDFSDPATFADQVPHEAFDQVRSMSGLYWQPTEYGTLREGFWLATRFADIVAVEAKSQEVTCKQGFNFPLNILSESPEQAEFNSHMLMRKDPPDHGRMRRVAAAAFGPRVVARFDGWIRDIVNEALDSALAKPEFDWVVEVGKYIPSRVVARVLGVADDRIEDVVDWTDAVFAVSSEADAGAKQSEAAQALYMYCAELQQAKLRAPDDDVATALAQAVERGDLNDTEFLTFIGLLLVAGYETTHTLINHSMRLIVENDEIRKYAGDALEEGTVDRLVDEFLRYITPAMNMARIATTDFEIAGTTIRKDDMIQLMFVAANRDPAVFSRPHEFDPHRPETATLTFGSGPHRCLGSALAKLELRILFEQLAERGVKLELNGEPKRGWSAWINQLHSLPVRVV